MLIDRKARSLVVEALGYSRVVFVQGARQVGKSTLAQQVLAGEHSGSSATLDDQVTCTRPQTNRMGSSPGCSA